MALLAVAPVTAGVKVGLVCDVEEGHDKDGADDPLPGVEGARHLAPPFARSALAYRKSRMPPVPAPASPVPTA